MSDFKIFTLEYYNDESKKDLEKLLIDGWQIYNSTMVVNGHIENISDASGYLYSSIVYVLKKDY